MRAVVVAVALCAALPAAAKCKTDGIFVFPAPGAVIPLNARFILEGAGKEKKRVSALVGQTLILRSKEANVPAITVQVKAGWESQRSRVAVVLLPSTQMLPGREYSLLIDKQMPNYVILNDDALDTLTWKSAPVADTTPPKFQVRPNVAEGIVSRDKDGISSWMKIRALLIEDSPAYFVVRVSNIAKPGSPKQLYPVPINGGEALLGHDACSGSFQWESDWPYRLEIETYDSAGNKAVDKIAPLEAKSPIEPDPAQQ
jgi:hypothetical protein